MNHLHAVYLAESRRAVADAQEERRARAAELGSEAAAGRASLAALLERAAILSELDESGEAISVLREAADRFPSAQNTLAWIDALAAANRTDEAVSTAAQAMVSFPDDVIFRWREGLSLPILYSDVRRIEYFRQRFSERLAAIEADLNLDTAQHRQSALFAVTRHNNFYLPYQMQDDRELQVRYSRLVHRIVHASFPELLQPLQPRDRSGGRLRVGFISANFHRHANSRSFGAWITGRTKTRVEAFVYYINGSETRVRDDIRRAADTIRYPTGDIAAISAAITQDKPDAVVFFDVGMNPVLGMLATVRLAPVQCATWGHPVTTGSTNVDYFLSSELMEPPDGDSHYSEALVRLPGIGVCNPKPLIPRTTSGRNRGMFGFDPDSVIYLCWQSAFKFSPGYDHIFPSIARAVPKALFVFQTLSPSVAETFRERLDRAFQSAGLRADDHCTFLPFLDLFEYSQLVFASDVCLDTLGFCGFTTITEAIACGVPTVTMNGKFQKGRQCAALLSQLGVPEMIAATEEQYIETAVRLGLDSEWRKRVVLKMKAGEPGLFSDPRSIDALETFLEGAVRAVDQDR